jgi:hypothetical protein
MSQPKTDAIVQWAEAHTADKTLAPNAGKQHLSPEEIADVLYWRGKGLTQEQIAAKFDPPKHQSTISRCLREWGHDRTAEAKRMIRAAAPRMVKEIVDGNDLKTKAVLLKGVSVLEEQQQQGVTVLVGNGGTVNLGQAFSPPAIEVTSERVENP